MGPLPALPLIQKTLRSFGSASLLGREIARLDTGTHQTLMQAANFIETIEERQAVTVACIKVIANRMEYIDGGQLAKLAEVNMNNNHGHYLMIF